jgi:hypothetical protein
LKFVRIKPGQLAKPLPVMKKPGIKKVGAQSSCFGFEFTKTQYACSKGEFDEVLGLEVLGSRALLLLCDGVLVGWRWVVV